jgi:glucose-1-phosphate thymidylyltransferase
VKNDEVLIVLGDTICEYNVSELLNIKGSVLCVKKVDDPRNFGVAETDEEGNVTRLIEKPQIPKTNNALVGIYKITETPALFGCLEKMLNTEGDLHAELALTPALDCMVDSGIVFSTFKVSNWFDCGNKETLLESNATLLKKWGSTVSGEERFENTIIIPPVSIAAGCEIKNSIIGPNVSIGENAVVQYAIIKDSIVGSFSKLFDVVLNDSLIGCDTEIKGETRTLNIGDNTEINLG